LVKWAKDPTWVSIIKLWVRADNGKEPPILDLEKKQKKQQPGGTERTEGGRWGGSELKTGPELANPTQKEAS